MIYALLAQGAATTTDLRAELTGVVLLLVVAIVKAAISHYDAKGAIAKATTEEEKAAASKIAERAAEHAGAAKQAALDAVVLGVEAVKRRLDEKAAKQTGTAIRVIAEARGVEGIVHEAVVRLTQRDEPKPPEPAPRADGLPRLALLPLLFALCLAPGCVSGAIHDSAVAARQSAATLHRASVPDPRYAEEEKAAWERLWLRHEEALQAIEEASR